MGKKSLMLLGTSCGTHWEFFLKQLIPSINPKRKETGLSWVDAEPSHWLHENYDPKLVCHHFQPKQIPLHNKETSEWVPIKINYIIPSWMKKANYKLQRVFHNQHPFHSKQEISDVVIFTLQSCWNELLSG
jgi:hypothetical protein